MIRWADALGARHTGNWELDSTDSLRIYNRGYKDNQNNNKGLNHNKGIYYLMLIGKATGTSRTSAFAHISHLQVRGRAAAVSSRLRTGCFYNCWNRLELPRSSAVWSKYNWKQSSVRSLDEKTRNEGKTHFALTATRNENCALAGRVQTRRRKAACINPKNKRRSCTTSTSIIVLCYEKSCTSVGGPSVRTPNKQQYTAFLDTSTIRYLRATLVQYFPSSIVRTVVLCEP